MECALPQIPRKKGSSRKVGEANKGLGEAPKSRTRKEHESATNSIARRGQGAIAPCRVKGQRPLWGLGQRPNSSTGDQYAKHAQQRCRQRSVPASNFARPQTRPQAALPQVSVKNQKKRIPFAFGRGCAPFVNQPSGLISVISKNSAVSLPLTLSTFSSSSSVTCWSTMRAPAVM